MRKLEIADPEIMRIAIQQEIVCSNEARYDHRLHGLLLVAGDQICLQVAEVFGENSRTVQRWVERFEESGSDGLREGGAAHLWDGKLLSLRLRQRYGVELGVRQCQRIFGQMGFRLRKPRPQIAQSDPERVATFKKTASAGKAYRH